MTIQQDDSTNDPTQPPLAGVLAIINQTPPLPRRGAYRRRLMMALRQQGYHTKQMVPVPTRGTQDGARGRITLVTRKHAPVPINCAIMICAREPTRQALLKLMQAPKGTTHTMVILRLARTPKQAKTSQQAGAEPRPELDWIGSTLIVCAPAP